MQAVSVTNAKSHGICSPLLRSDPKLLLNKAYANSFINGPSLWRRCLMSSHSTSTSRKWRRGSIVKATWLFNRGSNERETGASLERSEAANEDILIFFFQLDLATRVQCALNMEQYDVAQQLRNKLTEVETEIVKQREAKRGSSSKSEAQDKAIHLLRLRADLQKEIEKENYALAAELRDQISKLEAESLAASAKALAYENVQYAFRLGQKVRHKTFEELRAPSHRPQSDKMPSHPHHHPPIHTKKEILDISDLMHFISASEFVGPPNSLPTSYNPCHPTSYNPCHHIISNLPVAGFSAKIVINLMDQANNGYRAVICGMDPVCCESSSWIEIAQVDKLLQGPNQPFYQVLVDVHADPNLLVAYVPEENLVASDQPDTDRFDHPYVSFLFYGMDSAGDFIPVKQLREKYNRPRHEVPVDMNDEDGSKNT